MSSAACSVGTGGSSANAASRRAAVPALLPSRSPLPPPASANPAARGGAGPLRRRRLQPGSRYRGGQGWTRRRFPGDAQEPAREDATAPPKNSGVKLWLCHIPTNEKRAALRKCCPPFSSTNVYSEPETRQTRGRPRLGVMSVLRKRNSGVSNGNEFAFNVRRPTHLPAASPPSPGYKRPRQLLQKLFPTPQYFIFSLKEEARWRRGHGMALSYLPAPAETPPGPPGSPSSPGAPGTVLRGPSGTERGARGVPARRQRSPGAPAGPLRLLAPRPSLIS